MLPCRGVGAHIHPDPGIETNPHRMEMHDHRLCPAIVRRCGTNKTLLHPYNAAQRLEYRLRTPVAVTADADAHQSGNIQSGRGKWQV